MAELGDQLADLAGQLDLTGSWPEKQLQLCADYGVFQWFIEPQFGGQGWTEQEVTRGYLALSAACLTTTFIITQRTGACIRIATSDNTEVQQQLLPPLIGGDAFATVGISHLTTSRRHLATPVLRAYPVDGGYRLDGFSPWVTGAAHADHVVVGATVVHDDGPTDEQLLLVLPTDLPGVHVPEPAQLVGLTASHTGRLDMNGTLVDQRWVLAGPTQNVMSTGAGGSTGGLQTSTLALGLTRAALNFLRHESQRRDELVESLDALQDEHADLQQLLLAAADGRPSCSKEQLRTRANSLALRSCQAALAGAKGAGYVVGHPAGRWCREALFFLVWSCPQPVVAANLCELAGIQH